MTRSQNVHWTLVNTGDLVDSPNTFRPLTVVSVDQDNDFVVVVGRDRAGFLEQFVIDPDIHTVRVWG